MSRMKTFFIYALIIIVFYFYSNLLIEVGTKSTYKTIEAKEILTNIPKVEIYDAKATYINGYVEGKITNNTDSKIDKKYIKIDFYSKHNINLGTKYVEIDNLEKNETKDFRMAFKLTDVNFFNITVVEEAKDATEQQFISEEMKTTALFTTLILLCIVG